MTIQITSIEFTKVWSSAKRAIEEISPVDNNMLHLVGGLIIYWLLQNIIRGRHRNAIAWAGTFAAAMINELIDLLVDRWPNLCHQYAEGLSDLLWTLALPTFAALLGSWLATRRKDHSPSPKEGSGSTKI